MSQVLGKAVKSAHRVCNICKNMQDQSSYKEAEAVRIVKILSPGGPVSSQEDESYQYVYLQHLLLGHHMLNACMFSQNCTGTRCSSNC